MPLFLVPLIGLAIDGTMLYMVQAKLSAAVDGAALGAGRLLGTNANTEEIAGEFLNVNFPAHYWNSADVVPNIHATTTLGSHTIDVGASVQVPLMFMRVLGTSSSIVTAHATVTRRDTRVVLVLDRSGSMDTTDPVSGLNVFTTMKTSAKQFVGMFTPGTDELGLVVYSGSGIVAYPTTRPWDPSPSGSGGPNAGFATSPTAGPMFTQINAMSAGGGTNMSEALQLAYIELQKTHNRDLAANSVDNTLNAIVLFTDGVPTGFSVHPNDASALPGSNALKSTSSCTYNPENGTASTHMRGYIVTSGAVPNASSTLFGLYLLSAFDTSQTLTYFLGHPTYDQTHPNPSTAVSGCASLNAGTGLSDLAKFPPKDFWGTSTDGTAFNYARVYNGTGYSATTINGYHLALAAWNVTDNAGRTIRTQTGMNPVAIYTIGYTGNGGTDAALLKRLANTQDSSSYDPSQQTGKYIPVNSADQLSAAFTEVASELLRLAK
jgi:Flp pilus assembly protein TadG